MACTGTTADLGLPEAPPDPPPCFLVSAPACPVEPAAFPDRLFSPGFDGAESPDFPAHPDMANAQDAAKKTIATRMNPFPHRAFIFWLL
jgi:hypothetical protein